jgi:hypothetical protein
MNKEDFTKIGRIVKVNKKTANITVISDFTLPDSIEQSKILFIEIDGGLVPFFVIEASLRGDNSLVVMLEDYHLPEKALKEIREGLGLAPRTSVFFNSAMYFDFVGLKCFSRTNYCFLKKFFILKQSKQNDKIVDIRSVYCIILPKSH